MSRVVPLLVAAGACACLLNACSNDNHTALELGSVPVPVPVSTAPIVTAAPSVAPTSSAPAVDPATTEPTPATSISPEDQVKADFLADMAVRRRCGLDPTTCDYAALAVPGSAMDRSTRALMQVRIESNLRAVAGQGDVKLRVETVRLAGLQASVVTCGYDDIVIFDVGDPASPSDDVIFDDSVGSARTTWTLEPVNGRWRVRDGVPSQELAGGDLCGFYRWQPD